ncbi:MAG: inositol oxygenase [Brasilonema octagenarum HA4186-MV1]|nr:inositol oxygenase [Brasilonema octagenarum HA4186-MV1]
MIDQDEQEKFSWVKFLKVYDFYSQINISPDWQKLKRYYEALVGKI